MALPTNMGVPSRAGDQTGKLAAQPSDLIIAAVAAAVTSLIAGCWTVGADVLLGLFAVLVGGLALLHTKIASSARVGAILAVAAVGVGAVGVVAGLVRARSAPPVQVQAAPPAGPTDAVRPPAAADDPALARAREQSLQIQCAANLRKIGQALMIYANDNGDKLPPDLTVLDQLGLLRPKELQSPLDPNSGNICDFFYLPEMGNRRQKAGWLLAWSDPTHSKLKPGAAVLYTDGKAEFVELAEFETVKARFFREYEEKYKGTPKVVAPH